MRGWVFWVALECCCLGGHETLEGGWLKEGTYSRLWNLSSVTLPIFLEVWQVYGAKVHY